MVKQEGTQEGKDVEEVSMAMTTSTLFLPLLRTLSLITYARMQKTSAAAVVPANGDSGGR